MEQVTLINQIPVGNVQQKPKTGIEEEGTLFALLLQELGVNSLNMPFTFSKAEGEVQQLQEDNTQEDTSLLLENLNAGIFIPYQLLINESMETLQTDLPVSTEQQSGFQELLKVLDLGQDGDAALTNWFGSLTSEQQNKAVILLNQMIFPSNQPVKNTTDTVLLTGREMDNEFADHLLKGALNEWHQLFSESSEKKGKESPLTADLISKLDMLVKEDGIEGKTQAHVQQEELILPRNLLIQDRYVQSKDSVKMESTELVEQELPVKTVNLQQLQTNHVNLQKGKPVDLPVSDKGNGLETLMVNKDFSSELGKVVMRHLRLPSGITETKLQLHPQELGQIDIKLTANQGQITAQFFAETIVGKELLEAQIHQLKQSLILQGYQVDRIEVQQISSSSSSSNDMNLDLKNGFNFSEQPESKHQSKNRGSFYSTPLEENENGYGSLFSESGIDYTV